MHLAGFAVFTAVLVSGCATPVPSDFCKALEPQALMPQHRSEYEAGASGIQRKHDVAKTASVYAVFSNNFYRRESLVLPAGWQEGNLLDAQYKRANLFVVENLSLLERKYPGFAGRVKAGELSVVATGHSLGGGLAEHTAYCFANLHVVAYTFNPSPRNHKRSCAVEAPEGGDVLALRDLSQQPSEATIRSVRTGRIQRVHQSNEVLSPLRHLFSSPGYTDLDYRFTHGGPVSRHSMTAIAMGLTKVAACPLQLPGREPAGGDADARARYGSVCAHSTAPDPCFVTEGLGLKEQGAADTGLSTAH